MKNIPNHDILSTKSKNLKKVADEKPYFENTHQMFSPSWVNYKNPSLNSAENDKEDEDDDGDIQGKGKGRLLKIYGGSTNYLEDKGNTKVETYKGKFNKKYKFDKNTSHSIEEISKITGFEKNGLETIFKKGVGAFHTNPQSVRSHIKSPEEWAMVRVYSAVMGGKASKIDASHLVGGCSCNNQMKREIGNYNTITKHLEEHLQEKAGDPKDAVQAKMFKKEIKRVADKNLVSANKVKKSDELYKVSNPKEVQKKAKDIYGKEAIVYKSCKANKKYQILDVFTGKFVHFGDKKMEDFTKHKDKKRQERYLKRAINIKGNWRANPFSPNNLSILLLW